MVLEAREYPILEFDPDPHAKLEPSDRMARLQNAPDACVITYFGDVVDEREAAGDITPIGRFRTTTTRALVYLAKSEGRDVAIAKGFLGAAAAAEELEELIAMGFRRFLVCGGAGVLQKGIQVGRLVLPERAVRDEGASYHYLAPSREVAANEEALQVIEKGLQARGLPYLRAKTWTTDSLYRETAAKVARRVAEGCVTVEMEAAAFFAVSQFRGAKLGQILYGGDDLSGAKWDGRGETSRASVRSDLVDLCLSLCLSL